MGKVLPAEPDGEMANWSHPERSQVHRNVLHLRKGWRSDWVVWYLVWTGSRQCFALSSACDKFVIWAVMGNWFFPAAIASLGTSPRRPAVCVAVSRGKFTIRPGRAGSGPTACQREAVTQTAMP